MELQNATGRDCACLFPVTMVTGITIQKADAKSSPNGRTDGLVPPRCSVASALLIITWPLVMTEEPAHIHQPARKSYENHSSTLRSFPSPRSIPSAQCLCIIPCSRLLTKLPRGPGLCFPTCRCVPLMVRRSLYSVVFK